MLFIVTYANMIIWNHIYACNLTGFHTVGRVGSILFAWKTSKEIPSYCIDWYLCRATFFC